MKSWAALTLLLSAQPLSAQDSDYAPQDDQATQLTFGAYAQCVVKRRPKDAASVVLSTINNSEIIRRFPRLILPECLDPGLKLGLPGDYLRYGLAEALVRHEFARGLPVDFSLAAPLTHVQVNDEAYRPRPGKKLTSTQIEAINRLKEEAHAFRLLSVFGECVVRLNPQTSLALILAKPRSADETASFESLRSALSNCLPGGVTLKFTKISLRGTLAVNLYRLAKGPRVAAP